MRYFLPAFTIGIVLVIGSPSFADFTGPVVLILDGDTIEVLRERMPVRIRLSDIDAPENGQAFGSRSRQALAALVFRKNVLVREHERDRHGRLLAEIEHQLCEQVVVCETINVNDEMVRTGMAWAYRYRGRVTNPLTLQLEAEARLERRGLWSDQQGVEPWQWRCKKKSE